MHAPASDLPIFFESAEYRVRGLKILNIPSLSISGGGADRDRRS